MIVSLSLMISLRISKYLSDQELSFLKSHVISWEPVQVLTSSVPPVLHVLPLVALIVPHRLSKLASMQRLTLSRWKTFSIVSILAVKRRA